ncbi:MAG: hypothetical protein LBU11_03605, partial [Zoogloeaceae bacterium]|nr:hypothetical protein [Zoogloeaceae bacterium]
MSTPLIAQEIYLLERYSSPGYFKQMRDAFRAVVEAGYAALEEYMKHPPHDYRARPLNRQPDIVWGERVLPNLAETAEGLDRAYELLLAGDWGTLHGGGAVGNDFIAVGRDYDNDWMPEP